MSDDELAKLLEELLAAPQEQFPERLLRAPTAAAAGPAAPAAKQPTVDTVPAPQTTLFPWQEHQEAQETQQPGSPQRGSGSAPVAPASATAPFEEDAASSRADPIPGVSSAGRALTSGSGSNVDSSSGSGVITSSGSSVDRSSGTGADRSSGLDSSSGITKGEGSSGPEEEDSTETLIRQFQQAVEAARQERVPGAEVLPGTPAPAPATVQRDGLAGVASVVAEWLSDGTHARLLLIGLTAPLALISLFGRLSTWAASLGSSTAGEPNVPVPATREEVAPSASPAVEQGAEQSGLPRLPWLPVGGSGASPTVDATVPTQAGGPSNGSLGGSDPAAVVSTSWPASGAQQQAGSGQAAPPPPPPPFVPASGSDAIVNTGSGGGYSEQGAVLWRRKESNADAEVSGMERVLWRRREEKAGADPTAQDQGTSRSGGGGGGSMATAAGLLAAAPTAEEDLWRMPLEQLHALNLAPRPLVSPAKAAPLSTAGYAGDEPLPFERSQPAGMARGTGAAVADSSSNEGNGIGTGVGNIAGVAAPTTAAAGRRATPRDDSERWQQLLDNAEP